jgi:hypothetical protein
MAITGRLSRHASGSSKKRRPPPVGERIAWSRSVDAVLNDALDLVQRDSPSGTERYGRDPAAQHRLLDETHGNAELRCNFAVPQKLRCRA